MNKQTVAWWVAGAVVTLFLLGIGPLAGFAALGADSVAGLLINLGLFFVGVVAAIVAIYWGKR